MANQGVQRINLTNLLLNTSNPRFNPVEHQRDAINKMLEDQADKILVLAKHIVQYGLNPSDLIIVMPHGNQWVVREGNRRVTALKLIATPSLVLPKYTKLKSEFKSLSKDVNAGLFENIGCVVLNREEEINEWVRLKHTGQNEGAGTVGWSAQQTARFRSRNEGKPDRQLVFLDKLQNEESISKHIKDRFGSIKKTNFDRLIQDPDVRELLGIEIDADVLALPKGINPFLILVLSDLVDDAICVKDIYYKEDRQNYIEKIIKRNKDRPLPGIDGGIKAIKEDEMLTGLENNFDTNSTKDSSRPGQDKDTNTADLDSQIPKRRGRNYQVNRKTLIPASHKLTISSQHRLLKIFNELKFLSVEDYPNAVSVLFRVFIELSMDCFIDANLDNNPEINVDSSLPKKIDAAIKYLKDNKIMDKHELKSARQMNSNPNQTQSVKTFHAYVHNKDFTPSVVDLKSAWDDIWPFVENIWGCI